MNKQEIIKQIADKTKLSQKEVAKILDKLLQTIQENTEKGQTTTFNNFGSFFVKPRKARTIKVFGKELLTIAATKTVGFRFAKKFKKTIAEIIIKPEQIEPENKVIAKPEKENKEVTKSINKDSKKSDDEIETKTYTSESGKFGELITGKRRNTPKEEIEFELNYRGKIGYEIVTDFVHWTDKPSFPIISMPLKDALVLEAYKPKNNSTKGVCENLFYENLTSHFTDIRNSLVLPIAKKKYGYQPDLVYVDESFNLFIDIEIDEPYDGITRKPTHYYNSYDRARDYYFNEKGWLVIRFTEKQVFCQTKSCCKKIAEVVDKLINTTLLTNFEDIFDLTTEEQWTFEEAEKMALENYREQYLGIEFSGEHTESEELIIESYGNSNQTQTLPQNAKINVLAIEFTPELLQKKQKLESLIGKHIRFEYGKNDVTDLVKISEVTQNRNQLFMLGYSLIDNQMNKYELRLIDGFEVIESPILMQGKTISEIAACVDFAMENFKSICISYHSSSKNEFTNRTVSKLSFIVVVDDEPIRNPSKNYINYLSALRAEIFYSIKKDVIGYCHKAKEDRWFVNDGRIKSIMVLDTQYTDTKILLEISYF